MDMQLTQQMMQIEWVNNDQGSLLTIMIIKVEKMKEIMVKALIHMFLKVTK